MEIAALRGRHPQRARSGGTLELLHVADHLAAGLEQGEHMEPEVVERELNGWKRVRHLHAEERHATERCLEANVPRVSVLEVNIISVARGEHEVCPSVEVVTAAIATPAVVYPRRESDLEVIAVNLVLSWTWEVIDNTNNMREQQETFELGRELLAVHPSV